MGISGVKPARLWHSHTWWWDDDAWQHVEVVRGLAQNPWTTAATLPLVSGVQRDLVHAWRDDDEVTWQLFDPGEEEMTGARSSFDAVHRPYPVGLAIRSGDTSPAFTYFDAGEDAMVYGRWDDGEVVGVTVLPPCDDAYAPLELRADDLFSTVCPTPLVEGSRDIYYVFDDGVDPDPVEFRVFGNDGDDWKHPDLALVGDDAVVAAFNDDDNEVVVRWQEAGVWQGAATVLYYEQIDDLAVDARLVGEDLIISVIARAEDAIWYLEKYPGGTRQRRVDLHPEDISSPCVPMLNNVDIHLQNADDAWLSWQVYYTANASTWPGDPLVSDRFTSFRRADLGDHEEVGLTRPHNGTALVLEDDGDGWTCFYTEDENDDISLYVQHRDGGPILIEADTGAPSLIYPRSCEVGVDAEDNVHVVYGSTTTNHLRYRMRVDGVWEAAFDLEDSNGDVPATPHVALAVAWDGTSSVVYQRPLSTSMYACVLDTADQETWTTTCFTESGGGTYPDITTVDVGGYPQALVYGVNSSQIRAAFTSTLPGGWTSELVINNETSFDYSIASRTAGTNGAVVVAWSTGGSIRWASRKTTGGWDIYALESAAGEYPSVALDAWLKPAFSWTRMIAGQDRLRFASWEPHAKKRDLGDPLAAPPVPSEPPEGRFVLCDLKDSDYGTALELDVHGNPRITYRRTNAVAFTTRP